MAKDRIWEKFDKFLSNVIVFAEASSIEQGIDCLYPESLAIGILTTGGNEVNSTLIKMEVNLQKCLKMIKEELGKKKKFNETKTQPFVQDIRVSQVTIDICKRANEISENDKREKISISDIFLAIMEICNNINRIFRVNGLKDLDKFLEILPENKNSSLEYSGNSKQPSKTNQKNGALAAFCTNLTEMAKTNQLDPIISREKEVEMSITILCRRSKNNLILVGKPGVGKTAIVEGISQRIVSGTVPKQILNCRVFSLNISGLVAGTRYRGDFEERIHALVKEVQNSKDCILFIDEIHTLVGAGSSAGGALDASNILKPFLARNDLRCIGATTLDDYKKYFQKDGALARRFQQVIIEEPTKQQMYKIITGLKTKYEDYHHCLISEDAIDSIINLTGRYMPDKNFPDKAIDCMDMACAKYVWNDSDSKFKGLITAVDVAKIVSEQCQIPIEVIMWDDNERIKKIEENLSKKVIGQNYAINVVCRILKNSYSGIRNPNKPIGSFVLGGQSGTGKTFMAKQLAEVVFGKESSLIRLDMSEFSESHSTSKLIGSPPGYVGFQETDVFVDKVKRKPYCIVLLDEIEKASPEVMKMFLQVMSDGFMSDAVGNQVDFKNIVFVMTGNFGMNEANKESLGFLNNKNKSNIDIEKERLIKFCQDRFGVEFVNRVDEFIPFLPLDETALKEIAKIELNKLSEMVINRKCELVFEPSVYDLLIKEVSKEHGKNSNILNRLIIKEIEPCISDALLSVKSKQCKIIINVENNEFVSKKIMKREKNNEVSK